MNGVSLGVIKKGNELAEQFGEYLELLENELNHKELPEPLQLVAIQGLKTITGLDMPEWHKFQHKLILEFDVEEEVFAIVQSNIREWSENLDNLIKFIKIIPDEASRFYEDNIREEVLPLCERGEKIIMEMKEWMKQVIS